MPPSSALGAYSATTLPRYHPSANHAPTITSNAIENNNGQRIAATGRLMVMIDGDFEWVIRLDRELYESSLAPDRANDGSRCSSMSSILIDMRFNSIL